MDGTKWQDDFVEQVRKISLEASFFLTNALHCQKEMPASSGKALSAVSQ
jgi:sRNA-binding regulator protein Hfq